jgi:hypothetical protein
MDEENTPRRIRKSSFKPVESDQFQIGPRNRSARGGILPYFSREAAAVGAAPRPLMVWEVQPLLHIEAREQMRYFVWLLGWTINRLKQDKRVLLGQIEVGGRVHFFEPTCFVIPVDFTQFDTAAGSLRPLNTQQIAISIPVDGRRALSLHIQHQLIVDAVSLDGDLCRLPRNWLFFILISYYHFGPFFRWVGQNPKIRFSGDCGLDNGFVS